MMSPLLIVLYNFLIIYRVNQYYKNSKDHMHYYTFFNKISNIFFMRYYDHPIYISIIYNRLP